MARPGSFNTPRIMARRDSSPITVVSATKLISARPGKYMASDSTSNHRVFSQDSTVLPSQMMSWMDSTTGKRMERPSRNARVRLFMKYSGSTGKWIPAHLAIRVGNIY